MGSGSRKEEEVVKCVICRHGSTEPGRVTVTVQRAGTVVIIKGVPAQVCSNCGEYYLSSKVSERVLSRAEVAAAAGAEVEIIRYAA